MLNHTQGIIKLKQGLSVSIQLMLGKIGAKTQIQINSGYHEKQQFKNAQTRHEGLTFGTGGGSLAHALDRSLQRNFISWSTEGLFLYTNSATSVSAYPITCREFSYTVKSENIYNKKSSMVAALQSVINEKLESKL